MLLRFVEPTVKTRTIEFSELQLTCPISVNNFQNLTTDTGNSFLMYQQAVTVMYDDFGGI